MSTIYKLYSSLLARRLSRWMESSDRLPMTQKGFRAFNECHEHNFLAITMLDQTRRLQRKSYASRSYMACTPATSALSFGS